LGVIAEELRDGESVSIINQQRVLCAWCVVLQDSQLRAGHGGFGAGFDLFECFHGQDL
jgi:hypothetical protein